MSESLSNWLVIDEATRLKREANPEKKGKPNSKSLRRMKVMIRAKADNDAFVRGVFGLRDNDNATVFDNAGDYHLLARLLGRGFLL